MDVDHPSSLPEQASDMDGVMTSYPPPAPGAQLPGSHAEQGSGMNVLINSPSLPLPQSPQLSQPPQSHQPHTSATAERRPSAVRVRVPMRTGDPMNQTPGPVGEVQTSTQPSEPFEDADEDEDMAEEALVQSQLSRPHPPRYRPTMDQLRMMRQGGAEQEDYFRELSQWDRRRVHEITIERDALRVELQRYEGLYAHYQQISGDYQRAVQQIQQQGASLVSLKEQLASTKQQAEERVVSMQQAFNQEKEGHQKQIQELEQQWRGRLNEFESTTEARIATLERQRRLAASNESTRPPSQGVDTTPGPNVPRSSSLLTTPRLRARTPGPVSRASPSPYAAANFRGYGQSIPRHRRLMSVVPVDTPNNPPPRNPQPVNRSENLPGPSTSPMSPGSPHFHALNKPEVDPDQPVTHAYLHSLVRDLQQAVDALKRKKETPPQSHHKAHSKPPAPPSKQSRAKSEAAVDADTETDDEGHSSRRRKPNNKFVDIAKELYKSTFGIKHDIDILLHESIDLTGGIPEFDESDPRLDLMATAKSDWNRKVIHFLLKIGLQLQQESYPWLMDNEDDEETKKANTKLFEEAITKKFTRLRQKWRESFLRMKPDGTLETEAEAEMRLNAVASMTNKRARHARRRSERYDRRRRITGYQVVTADSEHSKATWNMILTVLEDLGERGMSSDESELEEGSLTQSFRAKKLPWRRNLDDILALVDDTRRLQGNGYKNQGCLPVDRTRDGELVTLDRNVCELPLNLYDEVWLEKQSADYIALELRPSKIRYPIHEVVAT
ncbi:hypothetical protein BDN72DRAFT_855453 [Pluteus cervinus]|uniref:Uncharacterized protein n=1 Tax=Pluteus cervinus TaxID=181527 RepID=A0ACD3B471_9AGAR|nr:hypothetical protein BDN72DRAFT_855453 [Pluteus cervinus]